MVSLFRHTDPAMASLFITAVDIVVVSASFYLLFAFRDHLRISVDAVVAKYKLSLSGGSMSAVLSLINHLCIVSYCSGLCLNDDYRPH